MTSRHSNRSPRLAPLVLLAGLLAGGCGGIADADWYYHWSCNGDSECLALNPTGAAVGTRNEGPVQSNCTQLMQFSSRFWNMPPATDSCDHDAGGGSGGPPPPTLLSIVVTPTNPSLPLGSTRQLVATGRYSDGSVKDLTTVVTWTRLTLGAITVSPGGLVTAVELGSSTVTASLGNVSGSTVVTVTAVAVQAITVAPASATVQVGLTQQFSATAHWTDGSATDVTGAASWWAVNPSVATVGPGGLASGVSAGATRVSASYRAMAGSADLTVTTATLVSMAVSPVDPTVAKGRTQQFTAAGTWSNGQVTDLTAVAGWDSSAPAVATVAAGGLASGLAVGVATVTASSGAVAGSTTLTVSAPLLVSIAVSPQAPGIVAGMQQRFTASGTYSDGSSGDVTVSASWSSATLPVATVDSTGLATGVDVGSSVIAAAVGAVTGTSTLEVLAPGVRWRVGSSGTSSALTSVAWTGQRFVATGAAGTILTSPDGASWASATSGTSSDLGGVLWTGSQVVAVGSGGTVLTSPDGLAWTTRASGTAVDLLSVDLVAGQIEAGGTNSTYLTSPDGVAWTTHALPAMPSGGLAVTGMGWNGSYYVAVGYARFDGGMCSSTDRASWTCTVTTAQLDIAVRDRYFTIPTVYGTVSTTTDGLSFSWSHSTFDGHLRGIAWSGTTYAIAAEQGTVLTSPDGYTLTPHPTGVGGRLMAVAWAGNRLVAVGDAGAVVVSP